MTPLGPRHDWRDADGLRHRFGDLDTSGNAIGITAHIDGISATLSSGGAQSPAGGVYPVNLTVPPGIRAGDLYLDISSSDAYNPSVLIRVGSGRTGAVSATRVRRLETKKTLSEGAAETL